MNHYLVIRFITWVLIAEVVLMITTSLFIVFIHYRRQYIIKKRENLISKAKDLLKRHITMQSAVDDLYMPPHLLRHDVIVPVIEYFDSRLTDNLWKQIKDKLVMRHLSGVAGVLALKKSWYKRCWGARVYALNAELEDEAVLLRLLDDPIPIVRFMSIPACMRLASKPIIEKMLMTMSMETRFSCYSYKDALEKGQSRVFDMILELYKVSPDPEFRKSCLQVLASKTNIDLSAYLERDIFSNDLELKLAALRVLINYPTPSAVSWLQKLILAPEWEVRTFAAQAMGKIPERSCIPYLVKALTDEQWWVRFHAALSLLKYGPLGMKFLRSIDEDLSKNAYLVSQYVLRLAELRN